ncbi:hypothetical protein ACIBHY_54040 [Nonomuraea sp. NPDC050547]|uniref:hypothetical protein n=1 Tax=Nonomuraea sp. NPDC050547 TaxID=3364368 RepID=UPI00379866C4
MPVPYVNAWTDEHVTHGLRFVWHEGSRGARLSYLDPLPQDWLYGALWARQGLAQTGGVEWRSAHPTRQRRCMRHGLCQVCGLSAKDPVTGRTWWLMPNPDQPTRTELGRVISHIAPTCEQCIPVSLRHCPRLKRGAAIYTAADFEPYAVVADVYHATAGGSVRPTARSAMVELDRYRALNHVLAKQLIVAFDDMRREDATA